MEEQQQSQQLHTRVQQFFSTLYRRTYDYLKEAENRKFLFKLSLGGLGIGIGSFLLFALLVYWGAFGKLPTYSDLQAIQNHTASEVYSEDGTLLGKYYIENRVNADFEEISTDLVNALVATEDARFFEHQGIDFRAMLRVFFKSILLSDDSAGGGSTLSQQLAKNLYPRQDYWMLSMVVNKMRELFIARRLERLYTKEELLRLYLNTVPFSENIYGVKVAAQRFFNKAPHELKLEEVAVLVGMLKATTYYNPVKNKERSRERRNVVLKQMKRYGYLEEVACDSLQQLPLETKYYLEGNNQGIATYFREHLRLELSDFLQDYKKSDGTPYNLYVDGLRIYTTLNASMQTYAEEAVQEYLPKLQANFYKDWKTGTPWGKESVFRKVYQSTARYQALKNQGLSEEAIEAVFNTPVKMKVYAYKGGEEEKEMSPMDSLKYYLTLLNTGLLAVEPNTGLVRAWVGGIDHKYFQYDHVKSTRQVGSTFKPIVYASALKNGMLPCEYTYNDRTTFVEYDNWEPRNSDGKYGGVYSMEGALSKSVNVVTVEVLKRSGVEQVSDLARAMGIETPIQKVPAIALGASDASLMDMVRVYSTFANRGKRPDLHYLDRIETSNGEVIASFQRPDLDRFDRALDREEADMMVKMLQSVVDSGTARKLRYEFGLYNDIAGKTGTTQNQSDGWFLGFTPKLVAGVWVGADLPSVHFRTMSRGQGSSNALPIWGAFMKKVYQDPQFKSWRRAKFTPPADTALALMQCPPYLEEMPVLVDFWSPEEDRPGFFKRVFGRNRKEQEVTDYYDQQNTIQLPPRRTTESEEEYVERIQQYREERVEDAERRERRKKFWSKVLFGKDKEEKEKGSKKRRKDEIH
ncbi:MAG: transglycosylase domain-containing protein [Bacteroidota bacterium]